MYRYTTPTITCTLEGVDFANVELVRIAFGGNGKTLVKEIPATDIEEDTVVVTLTQTETADLGNGVIGIQARVKYSDETVQATNVVQTTLNDVIDKVVI